MRGPSVTIDDGSLAGFSQSGWLQRSVHCVEFTTSLWNNGVCKRLFDALSQCIRLRSLTLTFSRFALSSPHLSADLSSVASTLQHFRINVASSQASCLPDLFFAGGGLQQLRSLEIESIPVPEQHSSAHCGSDLSLSCLASLRHLERFSMSGPDLCSPSQVEFLSQCLKLTHLDFGQWMASSLIGGSQVREAFATLMRRRKENGAIPSAATRRCPIDSTRGLAIAVSVHGAGGDRCALELRAVCSPLVTVVSFSATGASDNWECGV